MNLNNKVLRYNRHCQSKPEVKWFSDCLKVKKFMAINGSINRNEAQKIGVGRLAARIYDLRNKHNTPVESYWNINRTYKEYRLK